MAFVLLVLGKWLFAAILWHALTDATAVFDVDAIGLVNIVHNLNLGLDIGGNPIGSQTALLLGVGANPGALNLDEEVRRVEWKAQAGAEYIVTQPVFDLSLLEQFLKKIEQLKIPVICGIWPLTSYRNAEFMVNELRVPVPEHFMDRMRRADNAEKARQEGVTIAREMVERVRYLYPSAGRRNQLRDDFRNRCRCFCSKRHRDQHGQRPDFRWDYRCTAYGRWSYNWGQPSGIQCRHHHGNGGNQQGCFAQGRRQRHQPGRGRDQRWALRRLCW